ncbi:MAG: pyruvate, phosphate dikinase [Candidatus Micrarchaeota archaeon]
MTGTESGKRIYLFSNGKADGHAGMLDLLGGKGAHLAEMSRQGLPVPPGFTITTEVCKLYQSIGERFHAELAVEQALALRSIEAIVGRQFGSPDNPLLVSVRSGAKVSMPGMMETILNVGLTEKTLPGLIAQSGGNERFVYDAYRRLIMMYADVAMEKAAGLEPMGGVGIRRQLENLLDERKQNVGVKDDTQLSADDWKYLSAVFKERVFEALGHEFPDDPYDQLRGAISAVFQSWNGRRAAEYRRIEKIPDDLGTAVTVQAMVFGNLGMDSGTGVGFTRDPSTGKKGLVGDYLPNAQGEDVVAGIRTPLPIGELQSSHPEVFRRLMEIPKLLEDHYKDMQDFEFTYEKGRLYMLQTRAGKRNGPASVAIAADMVREGLIQPLTAVKRVRPESLDQLLHPMFDPEKIKSYHSVAKGIEASPGDVTGAAVFCPAKAIEYARAGKNVILVRTETSPEDVDGMHVSKGILTARGGKTSHAALVGRGFGKSVVVGCAELDIHEKEGYMKIGEHTIREGDPISMSGATGKVYLGEVPTRDSEILRVLKGEMPADKSKQYRDFASLLESAKGFKTLGVRANADNPQDARLALALGAQGIGLFRTEHMFYGAGSERPLSYMRQMILSGTAEERITALNLLEPYMKAYIHKTLEVMDGLPVTIRLLDPPLHEFVPKDKATQEALAAELHISLDALLARADELHEVNPMLGDRGVRLGIRYPEITEMQVRAIFSAACDAQRDGRGVIPEIMVPVVAFVGEFAHQKAIIDRVAQETMKKYSANVPYTVGTMIELPRACVIADELAADAAFFSFGTNDLTQTTLGFSRDDTAPVIMKYQDLRILPADPFGTLDAAVAYLVEMGVRKGRSARPGLKVGICGEHGGDPDSITICHDAGMDYVSCSPYRVPVAILAAAQAACRTKREGD